MSSRDSVYLRIESKNKVLNNGKSITDMKSDSFVGKKAEAWYLLVIEYFYIKMNL